MWEDCWKYQDTWLLQVCFLSLTVAAFDFFCVTHIHAQRQVPILFETWTGVLDEVFFSAPTVDDDDDEVPVNFDFFPRSDNNFDA